MENAEVIVNTANGYAYGLAINSSGGITIKDSNVNATSASSYAYGIRKSSSGAVVITSGNITGKSTSGRGYGIYCSNSSNSVTIGSNDEVIDNNIIAPPDDSTTSSGTTNKKTYYEGFVMIGYITIPKTNVKLPILDTVTPEALDTAVAVLYPSNPQLNEPGNVVIIGHNYRNGKFFSDNEKLSVGDKVLIKDTTGREVSYTIYQKFQTTEQDTSFYTRDTKGIAEITLSTCTDDSKARIILLAKADK